LIAAKAATMSDTIVDPKMHHDVKEQEIEALRADADSLLECDSLLADAIDLMSDFAGRAEILKALRRAIDILEESNED
jgi:hypothetical protein